MEPAGRSGPTCGSTRTCREAGIFGIVSEITAGLHSLDELQVDTAAATELEFTRASQASQLAT